MMNFSCFLILIVPNCAVAVLQVGSKMESRQLLWISCVFQFAVSAPAHSIPTQVSREGCWFRSV